MDSAQVEADTAALQKYVERLKGITDTTTAAQEKTKAFDEILGDSSQIAKDVARNTNNLDDVMKVYTASTKTATSVTAALGATLKSIGWNIAIAAVVAAIGVAVKLADEYLFHPYEHARDKAAEMSQAHEEAAQKVEELTKQIEELKAKMDECRSTTTGDIVDKQSFGYLVRQKQYLETNLELAKQLAEETAHDAREAVYDQQDKSSGKVIPSIQATYEGDQHERLQQVIADYKKTDLAIKHLDEDLANKKIPQEIYDARIAGFHKLQEDLRNYIKEMGDDFNTEMDTLLNNAPNEFSSDDDKSKYQERIKNLSDDQQAFLNFWNLYISSKDGSVYFDLDNSVVHTTDGQYVTTLDKNSIIVKSGERMLSQLYGYSETYRDDTIMYGILNMYDYGQTLDSDDFSLRDRCTLTGTNITFVDHSNSETSYLSSSELMTHKIYFGNVPGTITAQKNDDSGMLVSSFTTIQSRGNIQLYKTGSNIPSFYIYDGTTNWGGQTLGWDGSKEVTTLGASTQAVPFIYGIELVKNAQGYVTDVKLKQHGLRFIGGILV